MNRFLPMIILAASVAFASAANAGAMRIYHAGKPAGATTPVAILPNGAPAATPMTSAIGGVGGSGARGAVDSGRVWMDMNDGQSSAYSRYNIVASRSGVNDYIRSGRTGSRGLTGVVSSTFDNQIFYNNSNY